MSSRGVGAAASGALAPATRAVIAVGLLGMFVGFLWGIADVPRYRASATVAVAGGGGEPADPSKLDRFAALAMSAEVAEEAAARLGGDVAGADLLADLTVTPGAGTVQFDADAGAPDIAAAAANAFAEALLAVGGRSLKPGAAAAIPGDPSENRSAALWSAAGLALGLLVAGLAALIVARRRRRAPATAAPPPAFDPESRLDAGWPAELDEPAEPATFVGEPIEEEPEPEPEWVVTAEEAFGVPVVAVLGDPRDLIWYDETALGLDRTAAEGLLELAEDLGLEDADGPRTLAVLDAEPGEGSELVAVGLALAAGELGLRALVVDADLGDPSLAEAVGVDPAPGLRDYLEEDAGPRDVLRSVRTGDGEESGPLVCVPAGDPLSDPSPALGGPRFEALVERLPRVYDLVVFSGPPASRGGDAVTLAEAAEGVVLVSIDDDDAAARIAAALDRLQPSRLLAGVLTHSEVAQADPHPGL